MGTIVLSKILEENVRSAIKDTRYMNATSRLLQQKDSIDIALTIKNLYIEQVNAEPSQRGHLINQDTHLEMVILMIGTITQSIVATTVKNMNMFLKTTKGHISEVTMADG